MATDPTPTAREALARLLPSDAIIDSCGDYEDIEVGYRCQGWEAREWRALATEATDPLAARVTELEAENERLRADLAVFTTEPGVLARVGAEHTTYWWNAYQAEKRRADALEAARALLPPADGSRVER